jgi:hypothetical protein
MSNCDITRCDNFFKDKKCMCYSLKSTKNPQEEQICGYYKNGIIYECNAGCCPGGCPSKKCPDSKIVPKDPENYIPDNTAVITDPQAVRAMFKFDDVFMIIYGILLAFVALAIDIEFGAGMIAVLIVVMYINRNSLKNALHGIPLSVPQLWPLSNLSKLTSPLSPKT